MINESNESVPPLIDTNALNELQSIMEEEFAEVLQVFLDESVTLMSEIHAGFEEQADNLTRSVHTLKSCSKNVGAMRLGSIAEKMETHLLKEDVAASKAYLEDLQEVFAQSHALIKEFMQGKIDQVA